MRKDFTPLEIRRQRLLTVARGSLSLTGFTLLETMIAIAIFALAAIGVGGAIVSVQQSWQKQKANVNLINSARWGMEFMANEIRRGATVVKTTAASDGIDEGIKFRLPAVVSDYVFYWRGNGGVFGDASIIFRGVGPTLSTANSSSQELVNLIDGSSPIFSVSNGLVTIDFTVKKGNNSFRLKTAARPRN